MTATLLFGAAACLIVLTFRDYGVAWDEQWHNIYGEYIIGWYTSGFHDRRALDYWVLQYYGGLFDTLANSVARWLSLDRYDVRHVCNALFALLGVAAVYRISRYLQGGRAGAVAALSLLLIPAYYGHAFNNGVDIPFAALFAVALFYLVVMVREQPAPAWSLVVKFAVATGLSMGIRVGGFMLIGYYCISAGAEAFSHADSERPSLPAFGRAVIGRLAVIVAVSYAVMLVAWPAAQVHPFTHPWLSFRVFSHLPVGPDSVFFQGHNTATTRLPWYYLPKFLLLRLPEFVLAGIPLLIAMLAWRARAFKDRLHAGEYVLLACTVALPVVYAAVTHAKLYDGMRHFLFVLPAVAVLSAAGWQLAIRFAGKRWFVLAGALAGGMLFTLRDVVELHPYEYIYFNHAFGGGLARASKLYETEYWGTSYREGVRWVSAHYKPAPGSRLRVTSCSFPFSTTHFLPKDRFKYVVRGKGIADLFLATTRFGCDTTVRGSTVHMVSRQHVPLLYIKEINQAQSNLRRASTTRPATGG